MILSKNNLTMNQNIMHKLYITKKFFIYTKVQIIKMMTYNNKIFSFKTLYVINECFFFG
jgi:hypothetical protein